MERGGEAHLENWTLGRRLCHGGGVLARFRHDLRHGARRGFDRVAMLIEVDFLPVLAGRELLILLFFYTRTRACKDNSSGTKKGKGANAISNARRVHAVSSAALGEELPINWQGDYLSLPHPQSRWLQTQCFCGRPSFTGGGSEGGRQRQGDRSNVTVQHDTHVSAPTRSGSKAKAKAKASPSQKARLRERVRARTREGKGALQACEPTPLVERRVGCCGHVHDGGRRRRWGEGARHAHAEEGGGRAQSERDMAGSGFTLYRRPRHLSHPCRRIQSLCLRRLRRRHPRRLSSPACSS